MATKTAGDVEFGPPLLKPNRFVELAFYGLNIVSDGNSLLRREIRDAMSLTEVIASPYRRFAGRMKGRHRLAGFQQRRIFSRLADYTDVNDAEMQRQDPATRQAGGGSAVKQNVASANTIGRVDAQKRGSPAIRPRPVSFGRPYLHALA